METIEIIVYIGIAIIAGGLVLNFLLKWDVQDTRHKLDSVADGSSKGFEPLDKMQFASRLQDIFKECTSTGTNMSMTLYLKEEGHFTAKDLFDIYKELDWCNTIQSATYGCGHREDLSMSDLDCPVIVRVNCTGTRLYVR